MLYVEVFFAPTQSKEKLFLHTQQLSRSKHFLKRVVA